MSEIVLKERVLGFCQVSGQDLLLSKQHHDTKTKKSWYSTWIKTSKWNWEEEPTDREIMINEIVIETDEDIETNKKLTKLFQQKLREQNISYYTYFTSSKSFHIHFFVINIQKYLKQYTCKSVKEEIVKTITGTNYRFVDAQNFYPKKLIRLEGSIHPKTNRQVMLFDKFMGTNYEIKEELVKKFKTIYVPKENNIDLPCENQNGIYCYLLEEALSIKFPEGSRNNILLPNAVGVLNEKELEKLCEVQGMTKAMVNGWKKKNTRFRCITMRRYAREIGKDFLCKRCIKDGNFKEE